MAEAGPRSNETLVDVSEKTNDPEKTTPGRVTIVNKKDYAVVKPPRTDVFRENEKLREHW
jgi:hypothetical protein